MTRISSPTPEPPATDFVGLRVVSASQDRTVRVWTVDGGGIRFSPPNGVSRRGTVTSSSASRSQNATLVSMGAQDADPSVPNLRVG